MHYNAHSVFIFYAAISNETNELMSWKIISTFFSLRTV